MAVGTEIQTPQNDNFGFLETTNLKTSQLNIRVEVGYLNIPSRAKFVAAYVEEFSESQFYPTPSGKLGQSFAANSVLNPNKSQTLSSTVNGVMNQHFEVTGAPYCTFVEGTLEPSTVHPYYNLIKGPEDAPTYQASSTLQYATSNPAILTQFFQQNYNQESLVFNKVGTPFIPGTTKTSNAVAKKLTDGKIKPLTSYNIWEVENLGGIDPRDELQRQNKTQYFNFQQYLGFLPKPGATLDRVQPYAQTVSFSDTAEIQVFASNSQVSLRRYYPIAKDYAHEKDCKYLIYDSATGAAELKDELTKLDQDVYVDPRTKQKNKVPAVGFVLKFSSVVLNNIQPTAAQDKPDVLATPQILVSWGRINASEDELQEATKNNYVCKYTLKLTANTQPTLYFNISDRELTNDVPSPNSNSVVLTALKGLNIQDNNTGSKSPNNFQIHVYYSGPYMMIGNSTNPGEWQTVAPPTLLLKNALPTVEQPEKKLRHFLDNASQIRISAQFINFTYSYGPPLFSPYDPNNINKFTANTPNTLNFISGTPPIASQDPATMPSVFNGFVTTSSGSQTSVPENILNNAIRTFQSAEDFDVNVTPDQAKQDTTEINSPIMIDARANISVEDFVYKTFSSDTKFKLTFPKNAGGFTFNNFKPVVAPEPNIKEFYSFYNLKLQNTTDTVSQILSNAVTSISITKNVDSATNSRIESTLNIDFLNLNKSENGLKVLQFMRQNIATIRVSAGYETVYPFFEGMIEDVTVTEGLSETKISIKSSDLLKKLFVDDETLIVSTVFMKFNGMRYNKAINQMVYFSELNNHFKYALGDPLDEKGQTLGYALNFNPKYRLPRVDISDLNKELSSLKIGAYDDKNNTYFNLLKYIKNLSIQVGTARNTKNVRFDVPIYYWYTSGAEDISFQGTKEVVRGNGIVMSSRTLEKDRDIFYLSKKNISKAMTENIQELHGLLFGNDSFISKSNSMNLFKEGRYRYLDGQQRWNSILVTNDKDEAIRNNIGVATEAYIENIESYVGYKKLIMFDNSPQEFAESQIPSSLLPKNEYAKDWVERIFNSSFTDVYENITLKAFVTKPLKEWGSFYVAFEEETNTFFLEDKNRMPDRYLYQGVRYNFDINKNLITAEIDAAKKPIQALE